MRFASLVLRDPQMAPSGQPANKSILIVAQGKDTLSNCHHRLGHIGVSTIKEFARQERLRIAASDGNDKLSGRYIELVDGNEEKRLINRDVVFKLAREESSSLAAEAVVQAVPVTGVSPDAARPDTQVVPKDPNAASGGDLQDDAEELTVPQHVQG